jgi:transposase
MEHLLIDSTIIRAHRARLARKKSGGQEAQALGRSRGGFSTKIHIAVDALGNPLRLLLTAGQRHDSPQAKALIEDFEPQALIADKGYDSDALIEAVTNKGIEAVIPPKKNRLVQREYDRHLYRERHLIECFIGKIKHYRRVFSRFEKLSKNYLGFLSFVSALIWLR